MGKKISMLLDSLLAASFRAWNAFQSKNAGTDNN